MEQNRSKWIKMDQNGSNVSKWNKMDQNRLNGRK